MDTTTTNNDQAIAVEPIEPATGVAVMLTTTDNPYDYFTQFSQWYDYDMQMGYNTCGYLARVIDNLGGTTDDMTQKEEDQMIEAAIDEIIQYNPLVEYIKIKKEVKIS